MTAKRIILLADGTGNSAANPHKTNVWRLYQALDLSQDAQRAHYDNGVGTSSFSVAATLGKAFGWGLKRNVWQLYTRLCRDYRPGAEIYGFGYSRGAFTIRVLAALVADQGIIDLAHPEMSEEKFRRLALPHIWRQFRRSAYDPSLLSYFGRKLQNASLTMQGLADYQPPLHPRPNTRPLIEFLGVWDTVDAYGAPIDELSRVWDKLVWPLTQKDRNLSNQVARACHALSVDDQRESFEPMLWNEHRGQDDRIKQFWFPGVHGNVGGGYPQDDISYVPLQWMMQESGLDFIPEETSRVAARANPLAPLGDSRGGVGIVYRFFPREIDRLNTEERPGLRAGLVKLLRGMHAEGLVKLLGEDTSLNEVDIDRSKIHTGVFEHIAHGGDGYAPINLPRDYDLVDTSGDPVVNSFETEEQAATRYDLQCQAWGRVLLRKLGYYLNWLIALGFVSYPLRIAAQGPAVDAGWLASLVYWLPTHLPVVSSIPGLSGWAERFSHAPYLFVLFVAAFAAVLWFGSVQKKLMHSEMRTLWQHVVSPELPAPTPGPDSMIKQLGEFAVSKTYFNLRHLLRVVVQMTVMVVPAIYVTRWLSAAVAG